MECGIKITLGLLPFVCFLLVAEIPSVASADPLILNGRFIMDQRAVQVLREAGGTGDPEYEMRSFFVEVSELLKSLNKYDFEVDFRVNEFKILKSDIFSTETEIHVYKAHEAFDAWAMNNTSTSDDDFTYMITGYTMGRPGRASLKGVCKKVPDSTAISSITGRYDDVLIAAHEIGHLLGALHDEETDCSDGYVMLSGADLLSRNHFTFSSCSAQAIKDHYNYMTSEGNNCLKEGSGSTVSGPRMGSALTSHDVCKRFFGSTTSASDPIGGAECVFISCLVKQDTTSGHFKILGVPPGMSCGEGENKQCIQGVCVDVEN